MMMISPYFLSPTGTDPSSDSYLGNVYSLLGFDSSPVSDFKISNNISLTGSSVDYSTYKFGAGSLSAGPNKYLSISSSSPLGIVSDEFTVELWMRFSSVNSSTYFLDASIDSQFCLGLDGNRNFTGYIFGVLFTTNIRPTVGSWYHIAVSRKSGVIRVFVNGSLATSLDSNAKTSSSLTWYLGAAYESYNSASASPSNIDEFRLTLGVARYTGNFDPPTAQFPRQ